MARMFVSSPPQGDGREEVVACAWDGQTYIIDHNRTVVRFQFDENVNAFCAGEEGPRLDLCIVFLLKICTLTDQFEPLMLHLFDSSLTKRAHNGPKILFTSVF